MLQLFLHQQEAIDRALASPTLLVVRAPGTGKTAIGIHVAAACIRRDHLPALWVCPSHLISQLLSEWRRWEPSAQLSEYSPWSIVDNSACYYISYDKARAYHALLCARKWSAVISDESHRGKSEGTKTHGVMRHLRRTAATFIGLTATPFQNDPQEFFNLTSLFAGRTLTFDLDQCLAYKTPKTPSRLRRVLHRLGIKLARLNQGPVIGIRDKERFAELARQHVDFFPEDFSKQESHVPPVTFTVHEVPLTADERRIHISHITRLRRRKDKAFLQDLLPDAEIESATRRFIAARQSLISLEGKPSSKVISLVADLQSIIEDPLRRVLIFCNFVRMGALFLSDVLNDRGIPHSTFTGATSVKQRTNIVRDYLNGQKRVLVLSPVGFEGLDLFGTTDILILEPHFNPERTTQLLSRALRAFSPVASVSVRHYIAVAGDGSIYTTDQLIWRIAERKKALNLQMSECIQMARPPPV